MNNFEERLTGGHPNALGNTVEIVEEILNDHQRFNELFLCYFSTDATVRLRTSNAMKRICKEVPELLVPYIDSFISKIAIIDQASTQWTLASLFNSLKSRMTQAQVEKAQQVMQHNLSTHNDWIVLNETMKTLAHWAEQNDDLRQWLLPELQRLELDKRKSVSKRAQKLLSILML